MKPKGMIIYVFEFSRTFSKFPQLATDSVDSLFGLSTPAHDCWRWTMFGHRCLILIEHIKLCIDYDIAANVYDFASKFLHLFFNNFEDACLGSLKFHMLISRKNVNCKKMLTKS